MRGTASGGIFVRDHKAPLPIVLRFATFPLQEPERGTGAVTMFTFFRERPNRHKGHSTLVPHTTAVCKTENLVVETKDKDLIQDIAVSDPRGQFGCNWLPVNNKRLWSLSQTQHFETRKGFPASTCLPSPVMMHRKPNTLPCQTTSSFASRSAACSLRPWVASMASK